MATLPEPDNTIQPPSSVDIYNDDNGDLIIKIYCPDASVSMSSGPGENLYIVIKDREVSDV